MTKKYLAVSLITLTIFLLILTSINANNLENKIDETSDTIENTVENTENIINTITDPDEGEEYLKQELLKIIEKSPLNPIITFLNKNLTSLNPLWEKILGLKYSFSFIFIIALALLIALIKIDFDIGTILSTHFPMKLEQYSKWIATIILILITIFLKIPKYTALLIMSGIFSKGQWWMQIVGFILLIIIIAYLTIFSKKVKDQLMKEREKTMIKETAIKTKKIKKEVAIEKEKIEELEETTTSREEKSKKEELEEAENKRIEREAEDTLGGIGDSHD